MCGEREAEVTHSANFSQVSVGSAKRGDTEVEVRAISFRDMRPISSIKPSLALLHC